MEKYVCTNKSTPEEIQRYLDDGMRAGAEEYSKNGYDIEMVDGKPQLLPKRNGVTNPNGARTTEFHSPQQ